MRHAVNDGKTATLDSGVRAEPGRPRHQVSLRRKLLLGYGTTLLGASLLVIGAVVWIEHLGQATSSILSENYRSIAASETMLAAVSAQERATLAGGGQARQAFRHDEARFLQALGRARDNITISDETAILDSIETGYSRFLDEAWEGRARDERPDRAAVASVASTAEEVRAACRSLREVNEGAMYAASDRAAGLARRAIRAVATGGGALLGIGLAVALVLSRRAVMPLGRLVDATARVAAGDYHVAVAVTTSDEIGVLTREFNRMVAQLAIYDDRNVRRLMEEMRKSDAILRSLDDGVVVLDEANLVQAINPTAARFFETTSEAAVGRHFLEIHRDEGLFDLVRRAPAAPGSPPDRDARQDVVAVGTDGRTARFCMVSVVPIEHGDSVDPGKVLLLRDVTRLKELDRLKSEFISTASHELRGPLTSVAMAVAHLRETTRSQLTDDEQALLDVAEEDIARLRALVSDLLDLSRIESGRATLSIMPVAISAVVERVVQIFEPQARKADVALDARVPDRLPEVAADVTKITWVLSNLVSNALRYTEPGGHIAIAAAPGGRHVHISVKDDGIGIAPDVQGRVFDKFVQVGPDKGNGGTGLGLAICREIVHAHGGTIWVESQPGAGSTFTFTLPTVEEGDA